MILLRSLIYVWKFISFPLLGNRCRFYPSCSEYFLESLEKYGIYKGSKLGLKRVCRCHPLSKRSGTDPVP